MGAATLAAGDGGPAQSTVLWRPSDALNRCLILAALLHLLLVLVVGSAPPGTAQPGDGVWGGINVTLRGEPGGGPVTSAQPAGYTGPRGPALAQRWGGAVRPLDASPVAEPVGAGAAQLGTFNPTPTGILAAPQEQRPVLPTLDAAPPLPAQTTPAAPAVPSPSPAPMLAEPRLDVPSLPAMAAPLVSTPAHAQAVSPPAPVAAPAPPPPLRPPAPLVAPALPAPQATVALPPPVAIPVLPPVMMTLPAPAAETAPPLPTPRPTPIRAPAPLQADALSTVAPSPPSAVVVPIQPAAPAPVASAAPTVPTISPAPTVPTETTAPTAALAPAATAPAPSAVAASPLPTTASPSLRGLEAGAAPSASAGRAIEPGPNQPGGGAPEAGAQRGRDVPTPPSLASSAPRLNLNLPTARGGELSSMGSRGALQLMPRPPEVKSKLAEDIEKAARADCRKAYAGSGLLALGSLAVDAARDKGCRW